MMITTYTRWFLSKQWQRSVWWWCLSMCPGGRSCTEKPCEGEAGGGGVQAQDEGDWWWRSCYKCNVSSKKLARCWSSWWECSKRKAKEGNKSCLRTSLWRWGLFVITITMLKKKEEAETIDQQCHVLREMQGARRLLVGVEAVGWFYPDNDGDVDAGW